MRFLAFGQPGAPCILLIHGGGNAPWVFEKQAQLLSAKYRAILPELDGHGSLAEQTYPGTGASADKIVRYIDEACGGRLACIGGVSLGAQIALEVLTRKPTEIDTAYLESGIYSRKPLLAAMMGSRLTASLTAWMYRFAWLTRLSGRAYGWPDQLIPRIPRLTVIREPRKRPHKTRGPKPRPASTQRHPCRATRHEPLSVWVYPAQTTGDTDRPIDQPSTLNANPQASQARGWLLLTAEQSAHVL